MENPWSSHGGGQEAAAGEQRSQKLPVTVAGKLGRGYGKTKAAASIVYHKAKSGTSAGIHWVKIKYKKFKLGRQT